ncbi:MAG: zinc-binding alcohol dehydrogenase [Armatimonadota bacterium]|nr:zinc-binding alcohol dehydrogenase [Armatimonadota bacterium]
MADIPETRRAVLIHGDGSVTVDEIEMPELGPREVVVETAVSLISAGTECGGLARRRENPTDAEPRTTGYSTAGTVIAVGDEAEGFEVGQRVIGMAGECYNHCDYNVGHPMVTVPIPEGVSFDDAVMVCLAGTSMQAVRRLDPELGGFYAVVGQGLVGQFATQLIGLSGGRVAAVDLDDRRLEVAVAHGAEIAINPTKRDLSEALVEWADGVGIDGSLLAYGGRGDEVMRQLADASLKAPDGHQVGDMVVVGGITAEISMPVAFGNMDIRPSSRTGPGYHDPEYHLGQDYPRAYVRWTTRRNFVELLRRVADGSFAVSGLISHRFPFEDAPDAYDMIVEGTEYSLGVLLTYQ